MSVMYVNVTQAQYAEIAVRALRLEFAHGKHDAITSLVGALSTCTLSNGGTFVPSRWNRFSEVELRVIS